MFHGFEVKPLFSLCLDWEINQGRGCSLARRPTGTAWLAPREKLFYFSWHTQGNPVQISHCAWTQGCAKPSLAWTCQGGELARGKAQPESTAAVQRAGPAPVLGPDPSGCLQDMVPLHTRPSARESLNWGPSQSCFLKPFAILAFQTLSIFSHSEVPSPRDDDEHSEICYEMHLREKRLLFLGLLGKDETWLWCMVCFQTRARNQDCIFPSHSRYEITLRKGRK